LTGHGGSFQNALAISGRINGRTALRRTLPSVSVGSVSILVALVFVINIFFPPVDALGTDLASFDGPIIVNDSTTGNQANPYLTTTARGDIVVVWQDARSGYEDLYSARSVDGGLSFEANDRVDDSTRLSSKQLDPSAAASHRGIVYVVWQDNRRYQYDFDIYFSISRNNAASFDPNKKADDSNTSISWQERPAIAVSEYGTIVVAWTDDRSGALRIRKTTSITRGSSFSPTSELDMSRGLANPQTGVSLTANDDTFFAAFLENVGGAPHAYVCISDDDGETFGSSARLDASGTPGSIQRNIALAPMPKGGAVAVWEDNRNGDWDIYGRFISQSGAPLGTDVLISDGSRRTWQCHPAVVADPTGNVIVSWDDDRQGSTDIRLSYKRADESYFAQSVLVASADSDNMFQKPTMGSGVEDGCVYIAWQGDSLGTEDVYFSVGHLPGLTAAMRDSSGPATHWATIIATPVSAFRS